MTNFKLYGRDVNSIFQLIGYKENDITRSVAWVFSQSDGFLKLLIEEICGPVSVDLNEVSIHIQEYEKMTGVTDIEIRDSNNIYIIIEAKRGWVLPSKNQLLKYSTRDSFRNSTTKNRYIVTLSECSFEYADHYLPIKSANGIPIKHLSWKDIYHLTEKALKGASNSEKRLLIDLQLYLRGLMSMQNQTSNEVYVVSLGSGYPDNCSLSWADIVEQKNTYFHPLGGGGWPKEPPNYIAFRYRGKLQSIHYIEKYTIVNNLHNLIKEMPDKEINPHFVYNLGPAIIPTKTIKTGKIYPNGRVWCHLDTLLTCDTISDARDLTKERMSKP